MTDAKWEDGPTWLIEAAGAEGWKAREWTGWEIIRQRFDEFGPVQLEKTDPNMSGIAAYGEVGTFFETLRSDAQTPLYEALIAC